MTEHLRASRPTAWADFSALLDELIEHPGDRTEIEQRILAEFAEAKAIMVVDLCGFSRATATFGIVPIMVMIYRTRSLARPVIEKHGGVLVEAKADNLLCLFDTVDQALAASREIVLVLDEATTLLPEDFELYASIGIGYGPILNVGSELVAGPEVNLASKVGEDIADQGETLLTESAVAAVADSAISTEARSVTISGLETTCYCIRHAAANGTPSRGATRDRAAT